MSNVALGCKVEEALHRPEAVTNGIVTGYTGHDGFARFQCPGYLTVDLARVVDASAIRMLIWDGRGSEGSTRATRGYKYRLLTSTDRRTWQVLYDTGSSSTNGWQVFTFPERMKVRYVRLHGLYNSANPNFHVVEIEVHDAPPPPLQAETMLEREIVPSESEVEILDGLPIEESVDALAVSLERLLVDHNWVNPEPVHELIAQLRLRAYDISGLEQRIGSVRRQIVDPVEAELRDGRKFTVRSYWLGIAGGVIGLASLLLFVVDWLLSR